MISAEAKRLLVTATRVAPWGLAVAQAWLLQRLLEQQHQTLAAYDEFHDRLNRLERTLDGTADSPHPEEIESSGPNQDRQATSLPFAGQERTTRRIIYRPVTLKNGTCFDVAIDVRRLDPITRGIVSGQSWFMDDFYTLLDRMRPGDAVLDLGGHVGTFALAAAALGCRVMCVEAAPENVTLLNASVARNGFAHMRVVWGAVTDHEGTLKFLPHGPWGTIANPSVLRSPETINASKLAPMAVPALTVDGLLHRLGWERVDFVKLDVEGSEVAALHSMTGLLARPDAPILLYESNAHTLKFFGKTPKQLAATLRGFGYNSYVQQLGSLVPVRPDDFESESIVNCLAVKGAPPDL
jgi:FkbM family methyltransferase